MIKIEQAAWDLMVSHARSTYPDECCGAMLGSVDGDQKSVQVAVPLENAFAGAQGTFYQLRPEDLIKADAEARRQGMDLVGIFHSHPDCDAYFSKTDLENSCPWYSFVVLSIQKGEFHHANSFLPDADQTVAVPEELQHPR
ncbi:MAG: M67 family metallopeptidase [Bryobacteraceae bacterium]